METASISSLPTYDPNAAKYADPEKDASEMRVDFLKMLTAQLEHQDPMEPVDNSQFTAQMAQFSALEEQQQGNILLKQLVEAQSVSGMNQAVSFMGRTVLAEGNRIQAKDGSGQAGFELSEPSTVSISVFDEAGLLVRSTEAKAHDMGEHKFNLNDPVFGENLPDGTYNFTVKVHSSMSGDGKATTL
ncbi:MAG: hypothetical protein HQL53_11435 [Magnetococcales bacterium]|nr:hypothetical protein [Magnetococcales bacterium]